MKKSKFLKNILTTASLVAITLNAGNALGAENRNVLGAADQTGLNLDQDAVPGNVPVTAGSSFVFGVGAKNTYTTSDNNGIAAIKVTAAGAELSFNGAGAQILTLGPVTSTGGNTLALTVENGNGNNVLTFTGAALAVPLGKIANPGNNSIDGFVAQANDYTGLGDILLANGNNATILINSNTELTGKITFQGAAGNGNGVVVVSAAKTVTFSGELAGDQANSELTVGLDSRAVVGANSSVRSATIGNNGTVQISAGKTVEFGNLDALNANNGTLSFDGAATYKIGTATKVGGNIGANAGLNAIEIGAGIVNIDAAAAAVAAAVEITAQSINLTNVVSEFQVTGNAANAVTITGDIKTTTANYGKYSVVGKHEFEGSIGTAVVPIAEVVLGAGVNSLTLTKGSSGIHALAVTGGANSSLTLAADDITIDSNVGSNGAVFGNVSIGANVKTATLAAGKIITGTVEFNNKVNSTLLMKDGSSIIGDVDTNAANDGIISVEGNSTIEGIIGNANNLNQINFNANTNLTVNTNNDIKAQSFDFSNGGELTLGRDSTIKIDGGVVVGANNNTSVGTINADVFSGNNNHVLTLPAIGDAATGKMLKLLSAKGGGKINFSGNNTAITTIDLGAEDNILKFTAAGNVKIPELKHDDNKGIISIEANQVFYDDTVLSTSDNPLNRVQFVGNKVLTLQKGVNLYTANGISTDAAGNGSIVIEGDLVISGNIGSTAIGISKITVNDGIKATFLGDINLNNGAGGVLTLGGVNGATATVSGRIVSNVGAGNAVVVTGAAGKGTLIFNNESVLTGVNKIVADIGTNAKSLASVQLSGKDIELGGSVFTTELQFTSDDALTLTLSNQAGVAYDVPVSTTTSIVKNHNIKISTPQDGTFAKVGTAQNQFGDVTIFENKTINLTNDFYARLLNKGTAGEVKINVNNNAANAETTILTLGSANSELAEVIFGANNNQKINIGDMWSQDASVVAGQTVSFTGTIAGSNSMTVGAGSTVNLNNGSIVDRVIGGDANAAANSGTIKIGDGVVINKALGVVPLAAVEFLATADNVNVGNNITATNININAKQVTFTGTSGQVIQLSGVSTIATDVILDLGQSSVKSNNNNINTGGNLVLNTTAYLFDDSTKIGSLGYLDSGTANLVGIKTLAVNINEADVPLPAEGVTQKYTLLSGANVAVDYKTLSPTITITNNIFVKWEFNAGVLERINTAKTVIDDNISDPQLRVIAESLANSGPEVVALLSENSGRLKEAVQKASAVDARYASRALETTNNAVSRNVMQRQNAFIMPVPMVSVAAASDELKHGVWLNPFYSYTNQKMRSTTAGFKTNIYGATLGVDTKANEDLMLGIAASYAKSKVKYQDFQSGDKSNSNVYGVSLYAAQQLSDNWFVQGTATYLSSKNKASGYRDINKQNLAKADYDSSSYSADLMTGINYQMSAASVTPMVGVSYSRINSNGYTETGNSSILLTVNSKPTNELDLVAGVSAKTLTSFNDMCVIPEFHAMARYDLVAKNGKISSRVLGASSYFDNTNKKTTRFEGNLGVAVKAMSGIYEYGAGYDLFIANKSIRHQGSLMIRMNF